MYDPAGRLNGFTDSLTQIISAGAQAYKSITAPSIAPFNVGPYQGPNINHQTGQTIYYDKFGNLVQLPVPSSWQTSTSDYTVPLIVGGGLLLLFLSRRRR